MKLIMAVSKDGYVSREPDDDMSWTGSMDKAIFRLLTSVGGEIACGSRTYELMKNLALPGRRVHRLSSRPVQPYDPEGPVYRDLAWFQRTHPNGWLIGGQSIAINALQMGLVEEAYVCQSERKCFPGDGGECCVLGIELREPVWMCQAPINFGDVTVHVHKRAALTFPNRPVYPTKPLVFDDSSMFMEKCGCRVGTVCGSSACPHLPRVTC